MTQVAIVDYGLGNLFSVRHACTHAGLDAIITNDAEALDDAAGIILPGVGAFGDAMNQLNQLELADPLKKAASSGRPLLGICLGMQLLLDSSGEFGAHEGLGLVQGSVEKLHTGTHEGRRIKVPHVGWGPVKQRALDGLAVELYRGVPDEAHFYFVHSFAVNTQEEMVQSTSMHGGSPFIAGVGTDNVVGMQFHPERSGPVGLRVYQNLAQALVEKSGTS